MRTIKENKRHYFYDYYVQGNNSKRLTFILLVFAFLFCPLFSFLFKFISAPNSIFYVTFSGVFILPLILVLEKYIPLFKDRIPILYFLYFNVISCYLIYNLAISHFILFDFCFFITIFSCFNFALQRFYLSLFYFFISFLFLLFSYFYIGDQKGEFFQSLFVLFTCLGSFFLVIYYSRKRMYDNIKDHNNYLRKIVNNIGSGVILFQFKGQFIFIVDYNAEAKKLFRKELIGDIETVMSNLLTNKEIEELDNIDTDGFLDKEIKLEEECYLLLRFTKLILKNSIFYVCTVQEITEKIKENNLLKLNEQRYKNLYDRNQSGICSLDIRGYILNANTTFLEIFQKDNLKEIDLFSDKDEWSNLLQDLVKKQKIINYKLIYLDQFDSEFRFILNLYYDFETNQIEVNILDVTEIERSRTNLEEKELLYRSIYEESNDSIFLLDEDRIVDVNQKGLQLLNTKLEEVRELSFWDFTYNQSPKLKQKYDAYFDELKDKKLVRFPWILSKKNAYIEVLISIVIINIAEEVFYQCVVSDETDRNNAIRALEDSKRTFELIIENTPEGFLILKEEECLYVNSEFFKIFNKEKIDARKIKFDESYFGLNYPKFIEVFEEHKNSGVIKHKQLRFFINSKSVEVDLTLVAIVFNNEPATLLILKNVSFQIKLSKEILRAELAEESNKKLESEIFERKEIEKKLESEYLRTKAIFDSSQNTFLITLTPDLLVTSFNQQAKTYFDYQTKKELDIATVFDSYFEQIISPIKLRYFRYLTSSMRKGKSHVAQLKLINIYKEKKWLEVYLNPIIDVSGKISEFSIVAHDITDNKESEKQNLKSLKEKEVLLKEVHHRVKNNLQIISSILNLQSSYIEDEKILQILEESRHRIRSMAIIHENLYQTTNFSSINFKNYSRELVRNLISSYSYSKQVEIVLKEKFEHVDLSLDQAIPCGLIINELITNSMKYAFFNTKKGTIYLELEEKNNIIMLVVGDDGVGLPQNFDVTSSETLGLQLVVTLIEQLDGKLKIENKKGIKYFITFEKQKL
jgi:PAS domain S-box-containing protein